MTIDLKGSRCPRCRIILIEGEEGIVYKRNSRPPDGRSFYLDGDTICTISVYHKKCLPPNLFHRLAGSCPAGQSPAGASLSDEHVAGGGLSSTKKRKRPSRRTRYKRTKARRDREQLESNARIEQRQSELTIDTEVRRGVKPKLCACHSSSYDLHFTTANGLCRFCGGWTPRVFRGALGEGAIIEAINDLPRWQRDRINAVCGLTKS